MRLLAAAAAVILSVSTVQAQDHCSPPLVVLQALGQYSETIVQTVEHEGVRYDLWLNEGTGSWTITSLQPGIACVLAGGKKGYAGQTLEDFLFGAAL